MVGNQKSYFKQQHLKCNLMHSKKVLIVTYITHFQFPHKVVSTLTWSISYPFTHSYLIISSSSVPSGQNYSNSYATRRKISFTHHFESFYNGQSRPGCCNMQFQCMYTMMLATCCGQLYILLATSCVQVAQCNSPFRLPSSCLQIALTVHYF